MDMTEHQESEFDRDHDDEDDAERNITKTSNNSLGRIDF
jgi:hypothetical protein